MRKRIMIGRILALIIFLFYVYSAKSQCLSIKDLVDIHSGQNSGKLDEFNNLGLSNTINYQGYNISINNQQYRVSTGTVMALERGEFILLQSASSDCYLKIRAEVVKETGSKVSLISAQEENGYDIESYQHLSKDLIIEFQKNVAEKRYCIVLMSSTSSKKFNAEKSQTLAVETQNTKISQSPVQKSTSTESLTEIYTVVDEDPEFPGGYPAFISFIQKNFNYPQKALEENIQGKCYLKFIVKHDGTVSGVQVERGIAGCPECDNEALRLVKLMPPWKPGKVNGKSVSTLYRIPINFTLQ